LLKFQSSTDNEKISQDFFKEVKHLLYLNREIILGTIERNKKLLLCANSD